MTVNPLAFVEAMTNRWQTDNNTANSALKSSWEQLAETFNEHIEGINTHRWSVLHPPTGTGKSRGLALYCSMLSQENHPGVLIVVRMKTDADDLADDINSFTGSDVAIALHTDSKQEDERIYTSPVLIVTHSAYEHAMLSPLKWENLILWKSGKRKLTVIDERLNIIKYDQVHLDELRQLRGHLPYQIVSKHPLEILALDSVITALGKLADMNSANIRLSGIGLGCPVSITFDGLRAALKTLPLDALILHSNSPDERMRLVLRHIEALTRLEVILKDWSLYARKGTLHTLSTGKVIIPRELMNAVVMDATASFDPIYSLLGHAVRFIAPPTNIRNYANVTLHVSTGHKVGKHSLSKIARKEAATFMAGLSRLIRNGFDALAMKTRYYPTL